jgi:hypothetical protein
MNLDYKKRPAQWRKQVKSFNNEKLLDLYKQANPDSLNSVEFDILVELRKIVLERMNKGYTIEQIRAIGKASEICSIAVEYLIERLKEMGKNK